MKMLLPLLTAFSLFGMFAWARRSGSRFGQMIRESDHAAWRDAVERKEAELRELRAAEPRRSLGKTA